MEELRGTYRRLSEEPDHERDRALIARRNPDSQPGCRGELGWHVGTSLPQPCIRTQVFKLLLILATFLTGCVCKSENTTMSNEQTAPETKGPEIEGMAGRQLRMRMVIIEPGGAFGPVHNHKDRPGVVYVLQGTITDHRNGVSTDYGPGAGWPEDRTTTHWLENRGVIPAVEISVDIVRQE